MVVTFKKILFVVLIVGNIIHAEPHIHGKKVLPDVIKTYKITGCGGKGKKKP